MSEETVIASFRKACRGADLALIEGAMGLYDGLDTEGWGSPAHLARLLNLPVILIVDATRMTSSVAAMVSGYQNFQPDVNIAGVILNNVANKRHRSKLIAAVEQHCKIPVVGAIPRDQDLHMTQRHLGHIPLAEAEGPDSTIDRICNKIEPYFDLDKIVAIADAVSFQMDFGTSFIDTQTGTAGIKIGIMMDQVFNFYYPENLEGLVQAGAELVFIDSIHDHKLPDIDGLYIGGGFPEMFLQELEALARADPERAAQQLVGALKILAGGLALCIFGASGWLCNLSRRTYRSQRFPPPGVAVVRDVRVAIGAKARRRALLGFGLSGLTALAAVAVLWQIWRMIDVLTQGAG